MSRHQTIFVIAAALLISILWHFFSPNIPDGDSFFYLYLAKRLLAAPADVSAAWLPFTSIAAYSSSLWYGAGFILLPFAKLSNPALAIKLGGIVLTALVLISIYLISRRHRLPFPYLLPFAYLTIAPNVTFQLLMTRPQTLSLALGALLFSSLLTGSATASFFLSAALAFFHLNYVWLPLGLIVLITFIRFVSTRVFFWRPALASLAGVVLGALARPEPLNALRLFYIQVVEQSLVKQSNILLLFGAENFPLTWGSVLKYFSPFVVVWIFTLTVFIWFLFLPVNRDLKRDTFLWSAGILSLVFGLLSVFVARRAYELWALFGLLFIAAVLNKIIPDFPYRFRSALKNFSWSLAAAAFIFLIVFSSTLTANNLKTVAYSPDHRRTVGEWLSQNASPGDLVFNTRWADFSSLVLYNPSGRYVGGLDPIFQYAADPGRYFLFHYLASGLLSGQTCSLDACRKNDLVDTYSALTEKFNARYLLLEPARLPDLASYLASDSRFVSVLDTPQEILYRIER